MEQDADEELVWFLPIEEWDKKGYMATGAIEGSALRLIKVRELSIHRISLSHSLDIPDGTVITRLGPESEDDV